MKRKPLREQVRELEIDRAIWRDKEAQGRERIAKLEALVLAYKRFSLKVCVQRDLKHDAPPSSHALALKEATEAGAEVERLSRELWPEVYARLDAKEAGALMVDEGEGGEWN